MAFAGGDRFYLVEQSVEFFWIQFSIKLEAKKVIGEGDLWTHLQCLREFVSRVGLILAKRVVEQSAQSLGAELRDFTQALELVVGGGALLRIGGQDLQHREIELVNVIRRLLCDGGGKMALFLRDVALRAGKPAGDDMVGGFLAIFRCDSLDCGASDIELAETQGGGRQVQFAFEAGIEPCDLRAPEHRLGAILFFGCLGQDAGSNEGLRIDGECLARPDLGFIQVVMIETIFGLCEQTRFVPAVPAFVDRSESEQAGAKTKDDEERDDQTASDLKTLPP